MESGHLPLEDKKDRKREAEMKETEIYKRPTRYPKEDVWWDTECIQFKRMTKKERE